MARASLVFPEQSVRKYSAYGLLLGYLFLSDAVQGQGRTARTAHLPDAVDIVLPAAAKPVSALCSAALMVALGLGGREFSTQC